MQIKEFWILCRGLEPALLELRRWVSHTNIFFPQMSLWDLFRENIPPQKLLLKFSECHYQKNKKNKKKTKWFATILIRLQRLVNKLLDIFERVYSPTLVLQKYKPFALHYNFFLDVLKFNWIIIQQSPTINNLSPKHLLPDKIDIVYLHGYSWPLYDRTLVFKYAPHTVLLVALYTSQENSPALSAIAKVAKMFLDSMQIFPGSEDAGVTTFACVEETGRKLGMSEGRWQNLIKRAGLPDQEKKKRSTWRERKIQN